MDNTGYRQVDLPAILIHQADSFRLRLSNKGANELTVVKVFYEFSRINHDVLLNEPSRTGNQVDSTVYMAENMPE
jgi:hypothetical protein